MRNALKRAFIETNLAARAYVASQRLVQPTRRRCVMLFPNEMYTGSSGDLRACAIARELRRLGWRTVVVPPWLNAASRERIVRSERPSVIFLHQSRHPLNRPALYPGIPCVFDADDADILVNPRAAEECCRGSAAVIAGNHFLAEMFRTYNSEVTVIWTGSYLDRSAQAEPNSRRKPVLTWAQADPQDYPREAGLVRGIVLQLARHTRFRFHIYGARDSQLMDNFLAPIRDSGIAVKTFPPLRYVPFVRSLEQAAIGLQPVCLDNPFSRGKSFGKVLGYLAAGVAVVASHAVDHPLFFRHGHNGMLARDLEEWVDCCRFLLDNPDARGRMVENAYADFRRRLTTRRAAELVNTVLSRVAG